MVPFGGNKFTEKIQTPKKFAVITLKFEQGDFSECIQKMQTRQHCKQWTCSSRSSLILVCSLPIVVISKYHLHCYEELVEELVEASNTENYHWPHLMGMHLKDHQPFVCLFVCSGLTSHSKIFGHITTVPGCDRELNAHFYRAASLKYHAPDT